ncbi:hypothetical protein GHT06_016300 [Daphnia sinensis]|uniref:Matrin-type domain-containing protein n=1 Tax=Daphnia sinensis TaxID=1820382 RepID=A0AAD5L5N1_9CRUS|nr:hypothetical protein GHT06_016300 [Daphnia sinensis]
MPEFFCHQCNTQLNSKQQWDQHLTGGKHMRAAALKLPQAVDLSAAIALSDGSYKCKFCNDFVCSGLIPLEQHVTGQKHMKNVQRATESPIQSSSSSPVKSPPLSSISVMRKVSTTETATDLSLAMVQPDGSYKCKICIDFTCTGPIPMEAHLKGKSHFKNLIRNRLVESLPFEQLNISPPNQRVDSIPNYLTVEERIEKAWKHQTICGYTYDDSFPSLSVGEKIEVLNPHFAFIGKDDPMPNFIKYLNM